MTALQAWKTEQRNNLFEEIPCGVVVIDRHFTIVDENRAFGEVFGDVRGQPCYSATRGRRTLCPDCPAELTFGDGQQRTREVSSTDPQGRPVHQLVQITPVRDDSGQVPFVAAITTDLSATKRLQREYQTLFEKVPCYVTVVNRDYRVVKANHLFRAVFGEPRGEHCYTLLKHRHEPCAECPAEKTFIDSGSHTSRHVGVTRQGKQAHYVVSTAPLVQSNGETTHVIEMALDVTETHHLEEELSRANALRQVLVEHAPYGIVVLDESRKIVLMNGAAEQLWEARRDDWLGHRLPRRAIASTLDQLVAEADAPSAVRDTSIRTTKGVEVPVRVAAVPLPLTERLTGIAIIVQDLREVRRLEREKLDAERLAAVGQTVAGLAHGIKNILTGLEGGMYVTSSGLKKGDEGRTRQGWEMLERNIGRISSLARNLLAFSRGDTPNIAIVEPAALVRDVVELYRESAEQHGVELLTDIQPDIAAAPMDADGIHACLTNLISNALDACLVSHNPACAITVRLSEEEDVLCFEVADTGCGMDYEVKQKAFTSFFTTKGAGGTGLGLLLTRKIVQQHGGSVTFESSPDHGSIFRLRFPRQRLPEPPGAGDPGAVADSSATRSKDPDGQRPSREE
jgi:histidine kinase